jgi:UDP-N-acetylmuramate--alanine ligase
MFAAELRPHDLLVLLPVFDAGGTADRSVRSEDLASDLDDLGLHAECVDSPEAARRLASRWARPGDLIATLGARDPALPRLARELLSAT